MTGFGLKKNTTTLEKHSPCEEKKCLAQFPSFMKKTPVRLFIHGHVVPTSYRFSPSIWFACSAAANRINQTKGKEKKGEEILRVVPVLD